MISSEMAYAGTQVDALGSYAVFMSVGDYPQTFFCPFNEKLKKYLNSGIVQKGTVRGQKVPDKRVFVNVGTRETVVTDPEGNVLWRVTR